MLDPPRTPSSARSSGVFLDWNGAELHSNRRDLGLARGKPSEPLDSKDKGCNDKYCIYLHTWINEHKKEAQRVFDDYKGSIKHGIKRSRSRARSRSINRSDSYSFRAKRNKGY